MKWKRIIIISIILILIVSFISSEDGTFIRDYYSERGSIVESAGFYSNNSYDLRLGVNYYLGLDYEKLSIKEKLKEEDYQIKLRKTDVFRESNGNLLEEKFKSFNSSERKITIEDKDYKKLIELRLISDYDFKVPSGNDVKVGELLLLDWNKQGDLLDYLNTYNVKNEYNQLEKVIILKYGIDYEHEYCEKIIEGGNYCYNATDTNWVEFTSLDDLPHKNIKIGLFTDTTFGEKVEWVLTIEGFDILEYAIYDVTAGTKFEFDAILGQHNSLVKIDNTHYLNAYLGEGNDGTAVVLEVFPDNTIINYTPLKFDTGGGAWNSLVKINDTHYLNTYAGAGNDGYAVVLEVLPDWSVINYEALEFDILSGQHNSLVKINDTHYLNAYESQFNDGTAIVLEVFPNWSIIKRSSIMFSGRAIYNSLVKIDNTHYLNTYAGVDDDGYAVVFEVSPDNTIINYTALEFDNLNSHYNSLVKINDTHYLNTYEGTGNDGTAVVLEVLPDWSIINYAPLIFDTTNGAWNSLVKINDTHYLNTYSGNFDTGTAVVFEVFPNWSVVERSSMTFAGGLGGGEYHSLVKINETNYLNAYEASNDEGIAIILMVELPAQPTEDTCSPASPLSSAYQFECTDYCNLTTLLDAAGNNLKFNGTGSFRFIGGNITTPGRIFMHPDCKVSVYEGGGFKV